MVGIVGSSWRHMAVARPYDGLVAAWATGASPVYEPLAVSLVHASPIALAGKLVLDLGSGTGAVAQALVANGARVVIADCSPGMVLHGRQRGWTASVADALALPFRDGCFDAVIAGFLLNHIAPAVALTEIVRAVGPGGVVVASTWASTRSDPVKAAIGDVLDSWGWRPPAWYETLKAEVEPISGDPCSLGNAAELAGLADVCATAVTEDLGIHDPGIVVAYRLAMPQIAPWVARLGEPEASELVRELCVAVVPHVPGWRPSVIQLTGRVPAQPR
jgi:ubiquinone/menaquinone biosynthesis C-methylase UbiE